VRVAGERLGVDAPVANDPLFVRRRGAQDHRPVRPGPRCALRRRLYLDGFRRLRLIPHHPHTSST
jgi:hypothetical protein